LRLQEVKFFNASVWICITLLYSTLHNPHISLSIVFKLSWYFIYKTNFIHTTVKLYIIYIYSLTNNLLFFFCCSRAVSSSYLAVSIYVLVICVNSNKMSHSWESFTKSFRNIQLKLLIEYYWRKVWLCNL
jgi:hypothetical protein